MPEDLLTQSLVLTVISESEERERERRPAVFPRPDWCNWKPDGVWSTRAPNPHPVVSPANGGTL